jgi:WD40 repeat protein
MAGRGILTLVVAVSAFAVVTNVSVGGAKVTAPTDLDPAPGDRTVIVKTKGPRITALLPAGWKLSQGDPKQSTLVYMSTEEPMTLPMGVSFHRVFRVHDPRTHRSAPFPADFIGFLRRHPRLRTGPPAAVRVGGLRATQVDVTAVSFDPKGHDEGLCGRPSLGDPCVPISTDPNVEGWTSVAFDKGQRARFIYVRTPKWKLVIIEDLSSRRSSDRQWLRKSEPVIRSIRFSSGTEPARSNGPLLFRAWFNYDKFSGGTQYGNFVVSASGGRVRRLGTWTGPDIAEVSRDGSKIAWVDDVRVVITNREGRRLRVVPMPPPPEICCAAWSPRGTLLAVASPEARTIRIIRLDGRVQRTLRLGDFFPYDVSWSPTGQTLMAIGQRPDQLYDSLIRVDRNGRITPITSEGERTSGGAEWSPDGRLVVFATHEDNGELWTAKPDGTQRRLLVRLDGPAAVTRCCAWSPDGRYIAYIPDIGRTIKVITVAGEPVRTITINMRFRPQRRAPRRIDFIPAIDWAAR